MDLDPDSLPVERRSVGPHESSGSEQDYAENSESDNDLSDREFNIIETTKLPTNKNFSRKKNKISDDDSEVKEMMEFAPK